MNLPDPAQVIERVMRPGWRGVDAIAALRQAGWHLVSDAEVTRRDDPPVPDDEVEAATRYSAGVFSEPHRITTVRARVDSEIIEAHGSLSRYNIAHYPADYVAYADAELGRDFLALLGHRLGVPGCEDVPERLKQRGHP